MISLFKVDPKHTAEVLPSVPKHKKFTVCLKEKIRLLDKLHSSISYSIIGQDFNVNESTIYIK